MIKRRAIFYLFLTVGICLLLFCCGSEEPQIPAQIEKPPQTTSEPEALHKPRIDPKKARKIEELIRKLEGSDERAAYDAALRLALIGDETAVDPLIDFYERESGIMRVAALKALGSIGDRRALDVLLEALNDGDVNIRRNAAAGLGNLGDESAIGPLIEASRDQDDWVRMDAIGSLKKITGHDLPDYEAWSDWYQGR